MHQNLMCSDDMNTAAPSIGSLHRMLISTNKALKGVTQDQTDCALCFSTNQHVDWLHIHALHCDHLACITYSIWAPWYPTC